MDFSAFREIPYRHCSEGPGVLPPAIIHDLPLVAVRCPRFVLLLPEVLFQPSLFFLAADFSFSLEMEICGMGGGSLSPMLVLGLLFFQKGARETFKTTVLEACRSQRIFCKTFNFSPGKSSSLTQCDLVKCSLNGDLI